MDDLPQMYTDLENSAHKLRQAVLSGDVESAHAVLAQRFRNDIAQAHTLQLLAGDDSFVAAMTELALQGKAYAPGDLYHLYKYTCDYLLSRPTPPASTVPYSQLRFCVSHLAYWMLAHNSEASVTVEALDSELSAFFPRIVAFPARIQPQNVRQHLVDIGKLRYHDSRAQVAFASPRVQAFFAAGSAVDQDEIGTLLRNAHLPRWQEVVVMSAGQANKKLSDRILTGLIARIDVEKEMSVLRSLYEVLEQASRVVVQLNPKLKRNVEQTLNARNRVESA